jgi:hypothetical protein
VLTDGAGYKHVKARTSRMIGSPPGCFYDLLMLVALVLFIDAASD